MESLTATPRPLEHRLLRFALPWVGLLVSCVVSLVIARHLTRSEADGSPSAESIESMLGVINTRFIALHFLLGLGLVLYLTRSLRSALVACSVLLFGDHVLVVMSQRFDDAFSLTNDRSLPELYQYGKELTLAYVFYKLFAEGRGMVYAPLCALFAWILFDDAFEVHESVGDWVARQETTRHLARLVADVPAHAVGGLVALAAVFPPLLFATWLAYRRSPADARLSTVRIGLLLGLLAIFGVFLNALVAFDLVETAESRDRIELTEEFGEMVVMSVILAYATHLWWSVAEREMAREGADVTRRREPSPDIGVPPRRGVAVRAPARRIRPTARM